MIEDNLDRGRASLFSAFFPSFGQTGSSPPKWGKRKDYGYVLLYYTLGMTKDLQAVTVKLPRADLRRIPGKNRSNFIRSAVAEKLARKGDIAWKPKTETGRKFMALRSRFIRSGGGLLDCDGISEELRRRRGGLG